MLSPWLRIVRFPLAPTAACDALACGAFAWMVAGVDVAALSWLVWVQLAATSLLLYCAGMAANDLADREVDAVKDPSRPLPSGALRPAAVAVLVLLLLAGAVMLGGGPRGYLPAVIAAAAFAMLYDFGPTRRGPSGPVLMGLTRFANASIAVWPVVLSHDATWMLLLAPLCIGLYAAAITLHSQTEDEGATESVGLVRGLVVTAFAGAATLVWVLGGVPTLGVGVAFGVSSSTIFGRTPKPGPAKKQVLEMLLGLFWLAAVIAGGAHDGTISTALIVGFAALVAAWLLAVSAQLMIRHLRRAAA